MVDGFINNIAKDNERREEIKEQVEKEIQETFDKFTETEGVQTVVSTFQKLTDQVSAYLAKPEVRAKINKAKNVIINKVSRNKRDKDLDAKNQV